MQRTIYSLSTIKNQKSKRGRADAHIFVFRGVSRSREGGESQGGRLASRNAVPEKYKNMSSGTNGFLMSVLHSGVSHLFPFRTEK
jgi:hypothetical protein